MPPPKWRSSSSSSPTRATNALVLGTSPLLPIVLLVAALIAWGRRGRTRAVLVYLGGRSRRAR